MDDKLINIEEASEMLGVSKETLRNWERDGKIAPTRTEGGHRRYRLSEIKKLMGVDNEGVKEDSGDAILNQMVALFSKYMPMRSEDNKKVTLKTVSKLIDGLPIEACLCLRRDLEKPTSKRRIKMSIVKAPSRYFFVRMKGEISEKIDTNCKDDLGDKMYFNLDDGKDGDMVLFATHFNGYDPDKYESEDQVIDLCINSVADLVKSEISNFIDSFGKRIEDKTKPEYVFHSKFWMEFVEKEADDRNFEKFKAKVYAKENGSVAGIGKCTEDDYVAFAVNPRSCDYESGNLIEIGIECLKKIFLREMDSLTHYFKEAVENKGEVK